MIRVLVVEDENMVRRGLVDTVPWASMGCTVVAEASNGKAGVDLVHELNPDLVITDVRMPYMDGISMMKQLREEGYGVHFILLSAHSDFSYAQSAMRYGASDYLLKPLREQELKETIFRVFGLSEGQDKEQDSEQKLLEKMNFHPKEAISNRYVVQALQFLKTHYSEDITVSTVADYLEVSDSYLSRIFKKETGYTFTNYLMYYRMVAACAMLKDCRVRVYEVADKVGYLDKAYFSTLFKKTVGVSPSEYQSNWREIG